MQANINIQTAQQSNIVLPAPLQPDSWRLEIDEFVADTPLLNLYLIALKRMQDAGIGAIAEGETDWWTFYNLSGIHWLPNENWNKVDKASHGYCAHGQIAFPSWHRAYIYQFEQAVSNQMRKVATEYKSPQAKEKYQHAARRFRLPYWDPFMPRNKIEKPKNAVPGKVDPKIWGLPKILKATHVFVRLPGDETKLTQIENPLYSFTFPTDEDYAKARKITGDKKPMVNWPSANTRYKTTIRSPNGEGETDLENLDRGIQQQAQAWGTKVWHMLNPSGVDGEVNAERTWAQFSNHTDVESFPKDKFKTLRDNSEWKYQVSLESWHDDIHGLVGTGQSFQGKSGHMGNPMAAGFDPIFWLHHCNIDRMFALFQSLNPDIYLTKEEVRGYNIDTDLRPFSNAPGSFFNSADLRDWTKTGYAIPGNQALDDEGREIIKTYLRQNYYWATDGAYPPESLRYPKIMDNVEALHGEGFDTVEAPTFLFSSIKSTDQGPQLVDSVKEIESDGTRKVVDQAISPDPAIQSQKDVESQFPVGSYTGVEAQAPAKIQTWDVRFRVKKYAFKDSFNVHFFLGHVKDEQPERYLTKKNEAGYSTIFAADPDAGCVNCAAQNEAGAFYQDEVPLTGKLIDYLKDSPISDDLIPRASLKTIETLDAEFVVPFLRENLRWRVTDISSELKTEADIIASSLEVAVISRSFEVPCDENKLGVYGKPTVYKEITENKTGGYGFAG